MEFLNGQMGGNMLETGLMGSSMEKAHSLVLKGKLEKESGQMVKG